MRRLALAFAFLSLGLAGPAVAQIIGGGIHHASTGRGHASPADPRYSFTGPLDLVATSPSRPTSWFGLRAGSANIASDHRQPLFDLRSLATNETRRVVVEMSGSFGSVAGFCAGGCAVTEVYDQLGGSPKLWPTAADQPKLSQSCANGAPCLVGLEGGEFSEGPALPAFGSALKGTEQYLVFSKEWQCEERSEEMCAAMKCDGVQTKQWWRCVGPLSAGKATAVAGSIAIAAGSWALQIEDSGPFSAQTSNAVSGGLVSLNWFVEQRALVSADEIAPLLPKAGP